MPPQQNDVRSINRLTWWFWDENSIATAATSSSYFSNTAGKTEQQSNFPTNGQLPAGQRFRVDYIGFWIQQLSGATPATPRDVNELMLARVDFKVNNQSQLEGRLGQFPMGIGAIQNQALAAINNVEFGLSVASNIRVLRNPIYLDAQRIELLVRFLPAVTLAQTTTVTAFLGGELQRNPS